METVEQNGVLSFVFWEDSFMVALFSNRFIASILAPTKTASIHYLRYDRVLTINAF